MSERSALSKFALFMAGLFALGFAVLLVLEIFEAWEHATLLSVPTAGLYFLMQAIADWDVKRRSATIDLCIGLFFLAATAVCFMFPELLATNAK